MFSCPFMRTKLLFGIGLKSLPIKFFARNDFNFDDY